MSDKTMSTLDTLKKPYSYVLGVQHLVAMFGATVLVPILTGFSPSVAIFTAGVGTLLFHFLTKWQVPVFLGSSFAFIPLIIQVRDMQGGGLEYAQGGMMVAGAVYVVLALLVKLVGSEKITRFFPPQVVGPMIMVIGFNLIPVALNMAGANTTMAAITLVTALSVNYIAKGFMKQMAIITGIAVGCTAAFFMGELSGTAIAEASWISMPAFQLPKFSLEAIMVIAPVVLAVFMEHVGDVTTNGAVVGKDFIKDPGLHRTLLGDGIATMFASFVGGPANTTYGENTGVLAFTKNYNPVLLRIAAVFAIVISFAGKLGAALQSIPVAVMGGISLLLFTMIALIGIKNIADNKVKISVPNLITMVSILVIGLSVTYIPSITIALPIPGTGVTLSGLSLAAIVGVVVNQIFTLLFPKCVNNACSDGK